MLKNEVPVSISEQFHISANEQYNLRSNFTTLKLPKLKANAMKESFSYHGAKTWNNLPTKLKNLAISDKDFKNKLLGFVRGNNSFLNYILKLPVTSKTSLQQKFLFIISDIS